jgi:hypothetical protein
MKTIFNEEGYTVTEIEHKDTRGTEWIVSDANGIGFSTYFPPPLKLAEIKEEIAQHRREKKIYLTGKHYVPRSEREGH